MYELFHTPRFSNFSVHGLRFHAQIISGKLQFAAELENPIGPYKNSFMLTDYEWEGKERYVLHVGPLYAETFKCAEVREWVKNVVNVEATKLTIEYLESTLERAKDRVQETEDELRAQRLNLTA